MEERLWNSNYIKLWAVNFLLFFSFHLIVPLLPIYMNDRFHAGGSLTGIVLCGYSVTALVARLFSGYIVDSYSRRKVLLLFYAFFALFFCGYLVASSVVLFAIIRTLHGMPFATATVSVSTVMIDSLPVSRRTEGIGYFGISNNVAMAIGPSIGLGLYHATHNFMLLFCLSLVSAAAGVMVSYTVKCRYRPPVKDKSPVSFDRFFLTCAVPESITMLLAAVPFGILTTYLAIYCRDVTRISAGAGVWFAVHASGLILSRLIGARSLKKGNVVGNASFGVTLDAVAYIMFITMPNMVGYFGSAIVLGLGNGHLWPAMQNMFINLTDNYHRGTASSSMLVSWDAGMGVGIVVGGIVSETFSYTQAFRLGAAVMVAGMLFFFLHCRRHYMRGAALNAQRLHKHQRET